MMKVTIIGFLALLFIAGCASVSKKPISKDTIRGHGTQYVRFEDIQHSKRLFKGVYDLHATQRLAVNSRDLLLELHKKKGELEDFHKIPEFIAFVRSGSRELMLRIDSILFGPMFLAKKGYQILSTEPPILCIADPSGGNGLNANPCYVISLEDETFLKNLGQVARVGDFDKDGIEDLIWYEDVWEGGLQFGHAAGMEMSPMIFYRVEKGKLVADTAKNKRYWKSKIEELDVRIHSLSRKISKDDEAQIVDNPASHLLLAILEKFLHYRVLEESQKGWEELRKDLRHCDDQYFFFTLPSTKGDIKDRRGKYPIENIEKLVKESLERAKCFKRSP